MSMIKRGHSDGSRPSVISSAKKCSQCGHCDKYSSVCPKCQGQMVEVVVDTEINDKCPGGICKLEDK